MRDGCDAVGSETDMKDEEPLSDMLGYGIVIDDGGYIAVCHRFGRRSFIEVLDDECLDGGCRRVVWAVETPS